MPRVDWWERTRRASAKIFLPPALAADVAAQRRATFALATLAVLVPAAFVRGLQLLERGPRAQGYVLVAASVVALQLPWILRFTGSYVVAAHLGVAVAMAVLSSSIFFSGGIASFALLTLPFVALLATFLLGRRGGGVWAAITSVEVVVWAALDWAGASPPNQFPEATRLQSAGTAAFVLIVLVYAIGALATPREERRRVDAREDDRPERSDEAVEASFAPGAAPRAITAPHAEIDMAARAIGELTRRADEPLFELVGHLAAARDAVRSQAPGRSASAEDAAASLRDAERAALELREVRSDLRLVDQLMRRSTPPGAAVAIRPVLARALDAVAAGDDRSWSLRLDDATAPEIAIDPRAVLRLLVAGLRALGARARNTGHVQVEARFEQVVKGAIVVSLELDVVERCTEPAFPEWLLETASAQALFVMRDGRGMLMFSFARYADVPVVEALATA